MAVFLTGGPRPSWMDTYRREGPTFVKNDLGGTISAIGPMTLPPNDNGRLAWMQDESDQAKADRIALVDRLGCLPNPKADPAAVVGGSASSALLDGIPSTGEKP